MQITIEHNATVRIGIHPQKRVLIQRGTFLLIEKAISRKTPVNGKKLNTNNGNEEQFKASP